MKKLVLAAALIATVSPALAHQENISCKKTEDIVTGSIGLALIHGSVRHNWRSHCNYDRNNDGNHEF